MLDSGADVNLIKRKCVKSPIQINKNNTVMLQGISPNSVTTLGTINIFIMGKNTEFHLIPDDAPFLQDGILGIEFLRMHNAVLDFKNKRLLYDDSSIPFSETEFIPLKPRSVTPFYVFITNPEVKTGYIPLNKSINGVYFGEAIVTNIGGKAYLPIFNTSERAYNMEIPSITLQEFDTTDTLRTNLTGATEVANGLCVNHNNVNITLQNFDTTDILRQTNLTGATEVANGLCVNHNNVSIVSLFSEPLDPTKIDAFSHAAACSFEADSLDTQDTHRGASTSCSASESREHSLAHGLCSNFNIFNTTSNLISTFDRDRTDLILQLLRLDSLNSEEKDSLISLIQNHSDRFHLPFDNLEHTPHNILFLQ